MENSYEKAQEAAACLRAAAAPFFSQHAPAIGIICGSGLGGLGQSLHAFPQQQVGFADIPHFPGATGMPYISLLEENCIL
jgi:purine-nucleoside phosphorylase